jgi:predicted O-methyltransferase YrrM
VSPQTTKKGFIDSVALLIRAGRYSEAVKELTRALELAPGDSDLLWHRSVALAQLGDLDGALADLYPLLRAEPKNLEVRNQIRYVHRKVVPEWHFDMMHDTERNQAFEGALKSRVTPDSIVLEIGTGSGLLAMMAARAGARHVFTCERTGPVRNAAIEIIRRNGLADKITVLPLWSTEVQIPRDLPEKADILLGELFGPALLEEQALYFFDDARRRLLKPNGTVIPLRAAVYGAMIESAAIQQRSSVGIVSGFDLSLFNGLRDDPGMQLLLEQYPHRILSKPFLLREISFQEVSEPIREGEVRVAAIESGVCHGIVQWFELFTDETHLVNTAPMKARTHWDQYVQIFQRPVTVQKGKEISFVLRQFSDRFSLTPRMEG